MANFKTVAFMWFDNSINVTGQHLPIQISYGETYSYAMQWDSFVEETKKFCIENKYDISKVNIKIFYSLSTEKNDLSFKLSQFVTKELIKAVTTDA